MSLTNGLTKRQQEFVEAYLQNGGNATEAAKAVGYGTTRHSNQVRGSKLLKNPQIRLEIGRRQGKVAQTTGIRAKRAVRELAALAFSRIDHYTVGPDGRLALVAGAPENAMAAVQSVKYRTIMRGDAPPIVEAEIKLWDKPGALRTLGRHLGVFLPPAKPGDEKSSADKAIDLFHEMLKARNERMREAADAGEVHVVRPVVREIEG